MSLRRLSALLICSLGLGLTGCQVRPLYAPSAGAAGPIAELPAVVVAIPENRTEQVYRNALLFLFGGGAAQPPGRYELAFRLTTREQEVAVERGTGTPNAYQLSSNVSFLLKDVETGRSLVGDNVTATTSYTRSSQNFANLRARKDAEERLAESLAQLTHARLAAYFAVR